MRRVAIIVLLAIIILPQVPTTNALQSLYIQPGEYETWSWDVSGAEGFFGHFEVVNGTDITFFICNETVFTAWIDGQSVEVFHLLEDVTSGDYEFLARDTGGGPERTDLRWYLVFDNTDETSTAQTINADIHLDLQGPNIECNVEENDVLSGTWEFNVTGVDRFGIDSIECTIYASSYPSSFNPARFNFYHIEGKSSTFSLDTTQMENGSYYITIKMTDVCDNERQRTIHFSVENAASDTLGPPVIPLIVIGSVLGIAGLVVVYRKRKSTIGLVNRLRVRGASLVAELKRRNPLQASAKEEGEISEKEPANIKVVVGFVGTLALFSPIVLIFQEVGLDTWVLIRSATYHYGYQFGYEFMNPYILTAEFPLVVWRYVFVWQMMRYYEGRSSRRTTIILGFVAENIYVIVEFLMSYVILPGYWGPILLIPTPLMLFSALVFIWFAPYPVPKTYDDEPEPDKWWEGGSDVPKKE
jgi:hypothetical protein